MIKLKTFLFVIQSSSKSSNFYIELESLTKANIEIATDSINKSDNLAFDMNKKDTEYIITNIIELEND